MKFCIQDPATRTTFVADERDLEVWSTSTDDYSAEVDVLFVVPSDDLIQQLPATRLTYSETPNIQIVDPNRNKSWIVRLSDLAPFSVATPPSEDEDIVWFAMPSARELIAAVPIFRKALVQHGC